MKIWLYIPYTLLSGFLSSPIACVACERTELLRTEITGGGRRFCLFSEAKKEDSVRALPSIALYNTGLALALPTALVPTRLKRPSVSKAVANYCRLQYF